MKAIHLAGRAGGDITLALVAMIATAVATLSPRIPQWQSYHNFADKRFILGIPHFGDVVTNIPLAIVGYMGVSTVLRGQCVRRSLAEHICWLTVFTGVASICFGSIIYHWSPNNFTLLFDRFTMAITFAAVMSAFASERISPQFGLYMLPIWTVFCAGGAIYWYYTELMYKGDLRWYGLAQYASIALSFLSLITHTSGYSEQKWIVFAGVTLLASKVTEFIDRPIYWLTFRLISGHSVHHLLAASAAYCLLQHLRRRSALHGHTLPLHDRDVKSPHNVPMPLRLSETA